MDSQGGVTTAEQSEIGFELHLGNEHIMWSSSIHPGREKRVEAAFPYLFLFAIVFLFTGCEGQAGSKAITPPPPPEVLVAEVIQQDVPIYFEWIGTTEGYVNAQIRPRVQGSLFTCRRWQIGVRYLLGQVSSSTGTPSSARHP